VIGRVGTDFWVLSSNGSSFTSILWGRWGVRQLGTTLSRAISDADGKSDMLLRTGSTVVIAHSTGTQFTSIVVGTLANEGTYQNITVGDVNGDGRTISCG